MEVLSDSCIFQPTTWDGIQIDPRFVYVHPYFAKFQVSCERIFGQRAKGIHWLIKMRNMPDYIQRCHFWANITQFTALLYIFKKSFSKLCLCIFILVRFINLSTHLLQNVALFFVQIRVWTSKNRAQIKAFFIYFLTRPCSTEEETVLQNKKHPEGFANEEKQHGIAQGNSAGVYKRGGHIRVFPIRV